MEHHAFAAGVAGSVARRDPHGLSAVLTDTVRLRALLPGGVLEAHGRTDVAALLCGTINDFDTVELVESRGEPVGDRLLIHYRLRLAQGTRRWVCTQTAAGTLADGRLAVVNLLCSGFAEIEN